MSTRTVTANYRPSLSQENVERKAVLDISITGTKGPDPVSRFHSTSCHVLAFTCFQETNSGDATFVTEA
jgi:hypothetical protein